MGRYLGALGVVLLLLASSVLAAEQLMAQESDGRGWARDMVSRLCVDGAGRIVEVQATAERATFGDGELAALMALARKGIGELTVLQKQAAGV